MNTNKGIISLVESHLYSYLYMEGVILNIKEKYLVDEKDINSWIKSKGKINRGVENEVIKKIQMDEEIEYEIKWHLVIKKVIDIFKEKNQQEKIRYIKLKYFKNSSTTKIEMEMAICRPAQSRIKSEIIYYIALYAVKEDLISVDELQELNYNR